MISVQLQQQGVCPLILSLFPGIGMLDMAFEQEGFCVVRGPDLLWGGDVKRFHPPAGKFDGVIGGPPCQAFLRLQIETAVFEHMDLEPTCMASEGKHGRISNSRQNGQQQSV